MTAKIKNFSQKKKLPTDSNLFFLDNFFNLPVILVTKLKKGSFIKEPLLYL